MNLLLLLADPVARKPFTRRAGLAAARRGLRGPFTYSVRGDAIVASVGGHVVASWRPLDGTRPC